MGWFGYGLDATDLYFANEAAGGDIHFAAPNYSTIRMTVASGGNVGIGETTPQAMLHASTTDESTIGMIVEGSTGQTANLFQLQDGSQAFLSGFMEIISLPSLRSGVRPYCLLRVLKN